MRTSQHSRMGIGRSITRLAATLGLLLVAACAGPNDADRQTLREGYDSLDAQQYDRALAASDQYLRKHPQGEGSPEAAYLAGRAIEQRQPKRDAAQARDDLAQAQKWYEKARLLGPSPQLDARVLASLGNVLYFQENYAAADRAWQQAYEKLDDADVKSWVLYRIGLCRQRQAQWRAADEVFAAVQQQYPGTVPAQRARERRGATAFYVQVGSFQNAAAADKLLATLQAQKLPAVKTMRQDTRMHLVQVGPRATYAQALALRDQLARQFPDAVIVP